MAKIKHIALTTGNPDKTAAFYKEAFCLQEVRRSPNGAVFLTDGYINLAILNLKTAEKDADVGPNGSNYSGIHHIGFEVEELPEACAQLEYLQARAARGSRAAYERVLAKVPAVEPAPGDERRPRR